MLKRPIIYLGNIPSTRKAELQRIVKGHGGSIVTTPEAASHIVDWDEEIDSLPTEMTEEYVRTLEVRSREVGSTALVHWYYFPDSYDEWIPSEHVDGSEPPDTIPPAADRGVGRPWRVCCRFILDCELFNEWGNEVDYESTPEVEGEEEEDEGKSPAKSSSGRKARGRKKYDPSKAKIAPIVEAISATEKMMPDARPPLLGNNTVSVVDMQGGSECQMTQIKAENAQSSSLDSIADTVGNKRKAADSIDATGVAACSSGTAVTNKLPDWYHAGSVCDLEVKYLPEFFTSASMINSSQTQSKSMEEYMRIRNFIVNLYAQSAQSSTSYLSATDCRKKVAGDVGAILKIHDFLDTFGAINYCVTTDGRPALLPASFSQWRANTDTASLAAAGMLSSSLSQSTPAASRMLLTDKGIVPWSEAMDSSLKRAVVANAGDWPAVATALKKEFKNYHPTAQECLARFVSLPLTTPSALIEYDTNTGNGGMEVEGVESCAAAAVAGGKPAQRLRLLSTLVADRAAASLGCEVASEVVANAVATVRKSALPKSAEVVAPIAVAAAAISAAARQGAEVEQERLKDLMTDYMSHRLRALEEKVCANEELFHAVC